MDSLKINKINKTIGGSVQITGSKSESNRLLVLQQFYPNLKIENVSNSDDSQLMQKALASSENEISIGHAGTTMRFLTAYFAVKENSNIVLTGSHRMKNRPIKILVDALRELGAEIEYLEKEGYPPLKIIGKKLGLNFSALAAVMLGLIIISIYFFTILHNTYNNHYRLVKKI